MYTKKKHLNVIEAKWLKNVKSIIDGFGLSQGVQNKTWLVNNLKQILCDKFIRQRLPEFNDCSNVHLEQHNWSGISFSWVKASAGGLYVSEVLYTPVASKYFGTNMNKNVQKKRKFYRFISKQSIISLTQL
jgi:hypothetical protein